MLEAPWYSRKIFLFLSIKTKKQREKKFPTVLNTFTFFETHSSLWLAWWDYKTFCCHVLHQIHTFSCGLIIRTPTASQPRYWSRVLHCAAHPLPRVALLFSKPSCFHKNPPPSEQIPWWETSHAHSCAVQPLGQRCQTLWILRVLVSFSFSISAAQKASPHHPKTETWLQLLSFSFVNPWEVGKESKYSKRRFNEYTCSFKHCFNFS